MLLNLLLNARLQERDAKVRSPPFALCLSLSLRTDTDDAHVLEQLLSKQRPC